MKKTNKTEKEATTKTNRKRTIINKSYKKEQEQTRNIKINN